MADYSRIKETARRLIEAKGGPLKVMSVDLGAPPDPEKPWRDDDSNDTFQNVTGIILDFRPDQVEGYAYQRGDKICYIAANSVTGPITEENYIIRGDQTWSIINAVSISPSGDDILYELYIRQWAKRADARPEVG